MSVLGVKVTGESRLAPEPVEPCSTAASSGQAGRAEGPCRVDTRADTLLRAVPGWEPAAFAPEGRRPRSVCPSAYGVKILGKELSRVWAASFLVLGFRRD